MSASISKAIGMEESVTGQFESNGAMYTPFDEDEFREVLLALKAKGNLVSLDPRTGQSVDVDMAIELDCHASTKL